MIKLKTIFFLLIVMALSNNIIGQQSKLGKFKQLHWPEKFWIISHPFIAAKVLQITQRAQEIAVQMEKDPVLDGDGNGGQVDAFRHAFWMASLSQKIHWKKIFKLGVAYEKGNKIDYDKKLLEDGSLPDSVACAMDLRNNDTGICIGFYNKNKSEKELIKLVKQAVISGQLWKIKKNKKGDFLDTDNQVLREEDYIGKWKNKKCLVISSFKIQ